MDDEPLVQPGSPGCAALQGELTIAQANQLHEQLREALAAGRCHLDLSAVQECDSAGIQLLIATRHSARAQGLPLTLAAASPAVQASLQRYGLIHLLNA